MFLFILKLFILNIYFNQLFNINNMITIKIAFIFNRFPLLGFGKGVHV